MFLRPIVVVLIVVVFFSSCASGDTTISTPSIPGGEVSTILPTHDNPPPTLAPPTAPPTTKLPTPSVPSEPSAPAEPAPTFQVHPPTLQAFGEEVLFLRRGVLMAHDLRTNEERRIADDVRDFAPTPDGELIALIRGDVSVSDLWLVQRDGTHLAQLTDTSGVEAAPSWAPDGLSLVFAVARAPQPFGDGWIRWSQWCAASQVHLMNLPDHTEAILGEGCDPAFSPDGLRIAYASAPHSPAPDYDMDPPLVANGIRLVNRRGQNGWDFATAPGGLQTDVQPGLVVYAPSWSPDARQIVYQRFLGYQALVDINLSEIGGSLEGHGALLSSGAGWLLPARFAPNGRMVAITDHDEGDPRGFRGYDTWSVHVIRLEGSREIFLPSGSVQAIGQQEDQLARGQAIAWSPDGSALAVELPPGWRADLSPNEPTDAGEQPGDIWRWQPGAPPTDRLVSGVDFASPLAWLPSSPATATSDQGYRLRYPASWELAAPTEFEERSAVASDNLRMMSVAVTGPSDAMMQGAADLFSFFVAPETKSDTPIVWPDGSVYRAFSGVDLEGRPIAGATRVVRRADGSLIAMLYRSTPERWPLERALAQALLAHSGPM